MHLEDVCMENLYDNLWSIWWLVRNSIQWLRMVMDQWQCCRERCQPTTPASAGAANKLATWQSFLLKLQTGSLIISVCQICKSFIWFFQRPGSLLASDGRGGHYRWSTLLLQGQRLLPHLRNKVRVGQGAHLLDPLHHRVPEEVAKVF